MPDPDPSTSPGWNDNRTLGRALVGVLVGAAVGSVVVAAVRAALWLRLQDYDAGRRPAGDVDGWFRTAQLTNAWGAVTAAATVLAVVVTYRQAKNHEWFGRPATRFGSGWAIAAWLIPGAQAVLPALVLAQLWRGSDPANEPDDPDWRRRRGSLLIWLWLAVGVVTMALLIVTFVDSIDRFVHLIDAPYDDGAVFGVRLLAARPWLAWSAGIAGAVGHLLAAYLVNQIVTRQEALRAKGPSRVPAHPYASARAVAPGAAYPVPPGWYGDPWRQAPWRWWDGSQWTSDIRGPG